METAQINYKEQIMEILDELPPYHLKSVLDFTEYLRDKEVWEETQQILSDKELMLQLEEADKDWNDGNYKEGDYRAMLRCEKDDGLKPPSFLDLKLAIKRQNYENNNNLLHTTNTDYSSSIERR